MWTHVVWTWICSKIWQLTFRLTPLISAPKILNNFRFTQHGFTILTKHGNKHCRKLEILKKKYGPVSHLFSCTLPLTEQRMLHHKLGSLLESMIYFSRSTIENVCCQIWGRKKSLPFVVLTFALLMAIFQNSIMQPYPTHCCGS